MEERDVDVGLRIDWPFSEGDGPVFSFREIVFESPLLLSASQYRNLGTHEAPSLFSDAAVRPDPRAGFNMSSSVPDIRSAFGI